MVEKREIVSAREKVEKRGEEGGREVFGGRREGRERSARKDLPVERDPLHVVEQYQP